MAIQKPRTRLVNIRLSEEEFASLQRATTESGARSISDFCRNAILKSSGTSQQDLHEVERRLGQAVEERQQQVVAASPGDDVVKLPVELHELACLLVI